MMSALLKHNIKTKTLKQPLNVLVFYFKYCATAEIKQFRRLEKEFCFTFLS